LFIQRCLVTLFTIGLNSFPIVAGTDRKENTAALLLPCIATLFTESSLQALQFQYIIYSTLYFGRLYRDPHPDVSEGSPYQILVSCPARCSLFHLMPLDLRINHGAHHEEAVPIRVSEIPGSNLSLDIKMFVLLLNASTHIPGQCLELRHGPFFLHPFQLIVL
jgi:hypothetical protein